MNTIFLVALCWMNVLTLIYCFLYRRYLAKPQKFLLYILCICNFTFFVWMLQGKNGPQMPTSYLHDMISPSVKMWLRQK